MNLQVIINRCFVSMSITKIQSVITSSSILHGSCLLHYLSCKWNDHSLIEYPYANRIDPLANAFEMKIDFDEQEHSSWTWNSSFNSLLRMINELGVLLHIQSFPYLIVFPFSSSSYHSRNQ